MTQQRWTPATRVGFPLLIALLIVALAAGMAQSGEGTGSSRRFDLTLDGSMKLQHAGNDAATILTGWNRVIYDLTNVDNSLTVAIHSMEVKLTEDGQETFGIRLNRASAVTRRGETSEEESYTKAQPRLQTVLRSFDTPLVTVVLDPSGNEVKRTRRIAGATAKQFGDLADTILSVHPTFPAEAYRWEVPVKLITAQAQAVSGKLTFEKVGFAPGTVRVKVSGRLAPVGPPGKGEEVRVPSFTVSGEQVYDLAVHEWRSARWTIDMQFDVLRNGKPTGNSTGTLKLAMKAVKATPAEPAPIARTAPAKRSRAIASEKSDRAKPVRKQ